MAEYEARETDAGGIDGNASRRPRREANNDNAPEAPAGRGRRTGGFGQDHPAPHP